MSFVKASLAIFLSLFFWFSYMFFMKLTEQQKNAVASRILSIMLFLIIVLGTAYMIYEAI